jgi:hypothetical protein
MLVAFRMLMASSDSCFPKSMLRPLPYMDMIVDFAQAVVAGSCLRWSLSYVVLDGRARSSRWNRRELRGSQKEMPMISLPATRNRTRISGLSELFVGAGLRSQVRGDEAGQAPMQNQVRACGAEHIRPTFLYPSLEEPTVIDPSQQHLPI